VDWFLGCQRPLDEDSLRGGSPVAICDAANVFGASWAADGTIWFAQPEGVFRVAAEGGTPERMIEAGARERLAAPQLLPDGRTVLFTSFTQRDNATIAAYSMQRGARITCCQAARTDATSRRATSRTSSGIRCSPSR
jgi:Tol biopolymer transport system component